MTLALGLVHDEFAVVRASACRTLGVMLLHPLLASDELFVADVANAMIFKIKDSNLNVRMRASWTLANVTDVLARWALPWLFCSLFPLIDDRSMDRSG